MLEPPADPVEFESLCLDLFRDIWDDPGAKKNGRSGQKQDGVDVYGRTSEGWVGVQCKQRDRRLRSGLTCEELKEEVAQAENFEPKLSRFVVATTGPRDARILSCARVISASFTVEVWAWDDIWHELVRRKKLFAKIFPVYWPMRAEAGLGSIRRPPLQKWPGEPYPLLLPYSHPELFAGRDWEIDEFELRATGSRMILGFYAVSGSGKSSLIEAGLIPRLRAKGYAVARDRDPAEPGVEPPGALGSISRLRDDLFEGAGRWGNDPLADFVEVLTEIRRVTQKPAILILDQFEDLFQPGVEKERAIVAQALVATAARQPEWDDVVCRWILAYRDEYHGRISTWLARLETNLAVADRFHSWEPPSFGCRDSEDEVQLAFLDAIEKPLRLKNEEGGSRYPYRFRESDARRLAAALAKYRLENPAAPLVPELQVVLERLRREARRAEDGLYEMVVPEDPEALLGAALWNHLREAVNRVVLKEERQFLEHRFLLLSSLASLTVGENKRGRARKADDIMREHGQGIEERLEKLASPNWRILITRTIDEKPAYELSHDRLAEAISRELAASTAGELEEVARLSLLIRRRVQDFQDGQVTRLSRSDFLLLKRSPSLLVGDTTLKWWNAEKKARVRRNLFRLAGLTTAIALLLSIFVIIERYQSARRLDNGTSTERLERLADLGVLFPWEVREVTEDGEAGEIAKIFDGVASEWDDAKRAEVVYRAVRAAKPLLVRSAEEWQEVDFVPLGSALCLLDRFPARDPKWAESTAELRRELLAPLGAPPAIPEREWQRVPPADGHDWSTTFVMTVRFPEDYDDSEPKAVQVELSPFLMMRTEVPNGLYRALIPDHGFVPGAIPGSWNPAIGMSWDAAYSFSAWVGGRLPTEAEWEFAARAGSQDGSIDLTLYPAGNEFYRVGLTPANRWGLHDMLSPVGELTLNWFQHALSGGKDPWGLLTRPEMSSARAYRGGAPVIVSLTDVIRSFPAIKDDGPRSRLVGFRVVRPLAADRLEEK